mgnify:FL=1
MRTEKSPRLTLVSDTGGQGESGYASSVYGPVRAGLTVGQPTLDQQLEELLSCLERRVLILESKYSEACTTLIDAIQILVRHLRFTTDTISIEEGE